MLEDAEYRTKDFRRPVFFRVVTRKNAACRFRSESIPYCRLGEQVETEQISFWFQNHP